MFSDPLDTFSVCNPGTWPYCSGRSAALNFRPWKRAYRETLRNKHDAILPCIKTPARSKNFLFSKPLFHVNTYIYVRSDSRDNAQSLQQLKGWVDFIKTNPYVVEYMGSYPGLSPDSIRALPFIVESEPLYLMVPKSRPQGALLIEAFNRNYSDLKESGQLMEWTRDYFERVKPE